VDLVGGLRVALLLVQVHRVNRSAWADPWRGWWWLPVSACSSVAA